MSEDPFLVCLDVETFLIQEGRQVPPLVVFGATTTDGDQWVITHKAEGMYRPSIDAPWQALDGTLTPDALVLDLFKRVRERQGKYVNHNQVFDMAVLGEEYPHLLPHIFQMYEDNLVECTILRERLIDIALGQLGKDFDSKTKDGNPRRKLYNLKDLAKRYFKADLDKTTWRKGYGELYDTPFKFWEPGAKQYVIDDTEWTLALYQAQQEKAGQDIPNSPEQARAHWALYLTGAWGMRTDAERVTKYKAKLQKQMKVEEQVLKDLGVMRPTGTRNMQAIKDLLRSVYEGLGLEPMLTDTGIEKQEKGELDDPWKYLATGAEPVDDLLAAIKGWELENHKEVPEQWKKIEHLSAFTHTQKLLSTYIPVLETGTKYPINPKYEALVETGRASCVAPWTVIETDKGAFRIDELSDVLNVTQLRVKTHLGRWRRVTDCFVSSPCAQMYRVTLEDGSTLDCTSYHRLWTADGWRELKDLRVGDPVASGSAIRGRVSAGIAVDGEGTSSQGNFGAAVSRSRECLEVEARRGITTQPGPDPEQASERAETETESWYPLRGRVSASIADDSGGSPRARHHTQTVLRLRACVAPDAHSRDVRSEVSKNIRGIFERRSKPAKWRYSVFRQRSAGSGSGGTSNVGRPLQEIRMQHIYYPNELEGFRSERDGHARPAHLCPKGKPKGGVGVAGQTFSWAAGEGAQHPGEPRGLFSESLQRPFGVTSCFRVRPEVGSTPRKVLSKQHGEGRHLEHESAGGLVGPGTDRREDTTPAPGLRVSQKTAGLDGGFLGGRKALRGDRRGIPRTCKAERVGRPEGSDFRKNGDTASSGVHVDGHPRSARRCSTDKATTGVRIAIIESIGPHEVWDISVEEDESYCTQGFISHNCSKPNLMNLPKEAGVRECFVPREGFVYCSVDYEALELHTLAQACLELVGESSLAEALNKGIDPHLLFACNYLITDIPYDEAKKIRKDENHPKHELVVYNRNVAKAYNFGAPGSLGVDTLVKFLKNSGIIVTRQFAKTMKDAYLSQWPEMKQYFRAIRDMIDPSAENTGTAEQLFSGRIRGGVRYTALCNTYFQGLGADCAKESLHYLCKESYLEGGSMYGSRLVAFIHDETIMEHPEHLAAERGAIQAKIMREVGNRFCKDVPLKAEPCLMRFWSKKAIETFEDGILVPWDGDFDKIVGITQLPGKFAA